MGRLGVAFAAFFRVLSDRKIAESIGDLLSGKLPAIAAGSPSKPAKVGPAPAKSRSDAVALLASLQREARFIDLVQEPLEGYADAQIGAAARDVLRDCRKVLDQSFAIRPILDEAEGATIEVKPGYDPGIYRLTGTVTGPGPFRGNLVHRGWRITQCQLPTWTGTPEAGIVLAAVELEVS